MTDPRFAPPDPPDPSTGAGWVAAGHPATADAAAAMLHAGGNAFDAAHAGQTLDFRQYASRRVVTQGYGVPRGIGG